VLGNTLKKLMPSGGRVVAFVGTLAADNASQRLKGVQDVLAGSRIEIVSIKEDNKDPVRARANVEEVVATRPDVTGFIGLWSYNTPQIAAVAKASGKAGQFVIVGFDEEEATLQAIAEGVVKATVVQKPFEFGYRSVKLLHDLARQGAAALPRDPIIDTGVEVVTADNVAAFSARQAELRKQ
jgi:ribose transport system substrate-binding protein